MGLRSLSTSNPKPYVNFEPTPRLPCAQEAADAVRFHLPADASPWVRAAAAFCQRRLRLPELLLVVLFSIRPWVWAAAAAWLVGAPLAHRFEVRLQCSVSLGHSGL